MDRILALVGVILGILGIVFSYYFYRRSIRAKEPVYSIKSNNLISDSRFTLEKLNITYGSGKQKIQNLTVSKVLFYNRGAETINRADIETKNRVSISPRNSEILDVSLLQANNDSNNSGLLWHESGEFLYIDFDYLDKNQGAVIQVIHTGLSSDDLQVIGDIKGTRELTKIPSSRFQLQHFWREHLSFSKRLYIVELFFLAILMFFWLLLAFIAIRFPGTMDFLPKSPLEWFGFSGMIILPIFLFYDIFFSRQIGLPRGLEKFLE